MLSLVAALACCDSGSHVELKLVEAREGAVCEVLVCRPCMTPTWMVLSSASPSKCTCVYVSHHLQLLSGAWANSSLSSSLCPWLPAFRELGVRYLNWLKLCPISLGIKRGGKSPDFGAGASRCFCWMPRGFHFLL